MSKFFKSTTLLLFGLICGIALLPSAVSYANTSSTSGLKHSSSSSDFKKGRRYEKKRAIKSAIKWYKKAANKSHRRAQYRLGILYYKQKKYTKAKYWLRKRAKAGEPDAQYHYANILRFGLGTTRRQSSAAKRWYLKAAKQGHKQAQYELALMYKKGMGTKRNLTAAKKWFKRAARKNHRQAKQALKLIRKQQAAKARKRKKAKKVAELTKPASVTKRKVRPKKVAKISPKKKKIKPKVTTMLNAAQLGNAEDQYDMGMRYLLGYKMGPDNQQAIYWLNLAAAQNHPYAMYQLGSEYLAGNIVQRDINKALHYLAQASNKSVKAASTAISIYADNGYKNRVDAETGDKIAQMELAQAYLDNPVISEQKKGLEWLIKAADQAFPAALMTLAKVYETGTITPRSYEKAFVAYQAAAKQNIAPAQYRLGRMYQSGIGTILNQQLAYRWFEKAASQGHLEAQQALQFSGL